MAFSFSGGSGPRRGRRFGGPSVVSEINIVPLVDVVLVLLVIFMITANVMEFGLDIDVPKVKTVRDTAESLPVVSISKTGESFLNDKATNINSLATEIRQRFRNPKAVYVRADKETTWETLAQVVAELGDAKLEVKMVTAPTDFARRGRR